MSHERERHVVRISTPTLATVVVLAGAGARAQSPTAPVWVPQAPPFGTIATLSLLPDLRSIQPVAGPPVTDIRVADWSPLRQGPGRVLRLLEVDGAITPTLILWWFGTLGPPAPPENSTRRCTMSAESGRVCIQPVLVREQDWKTLMQSLLVAQPCPRSRPTDGYELRLQVYASRASPPFREAEVCNSVADDLR